MVFRIALAAGWRGIAWCVLLFSNPAMADDIALGFPADCAIGKTCWIQQYADHDGSKAAQDYACGGQTYDGHDGTDIRVKDMSAKVDVIAAADGIVLGSRDGEADWLVRTEADRAVVKDKECGNGVLLDHGNGWQTQYCHMRRGSVVVKKGERVLKEQTLGEVGASGFAAFPHVHLTVRKDGEPVDPFNAQPVADPLCGAAEATLWSADALDVLGPAAGYRPGDVIGLGFAPGRVEMAALEEGRQTAGTIASDWPAIVGYAWMINLRKDDTMTLTLEGPGGFNVKNTIKLDRDKAQYLIFTGKKPPQGGWTKGAYSARVTVSDAKSTRIDEKSEAQLK